MGNTEEHLVDRKAIPSAQNTLNEAVAKALSRTDLR